MVSITMPGVAWMLQYSAVDVHLDELVKEGSQELTVKMIALHCLLAVQSITESWNCKFES